MRRFTAVLRKSYGEFRWFWKLEFQENGWAHWHVLWEYKKRIDFAVIDKAWKLGRTETQMVKQENFDYVFKYAFKANEIQNGHYCLPDWFLDYSTYETVTVDGQEVLKPRTFSRIRFIQHSPGFFSSKYDPPEKQEPKTCLVPYTVRYVADGRRFKVVAVARSESGVYLGSSVVQITVSASEFFGHLHILNLMGKATPMLYGYSMCCHLTLIEKIACLPLPKKIKKDRLTPQAERINKGQPF